MSTAIADPRCLGTSGSVRFSAGCPGRESAPVVHTFWPVTTHASPSRSARVDSPARSDPAPGSLEQLAPDVVGPQDPGQVVASLLVGAPPDERRADHVGAHREHASDDVVGTSSAANTPARSGDRSRCRARPATTAPPSRCRAFGALPGPRLGDERPSSARCGSGRSACRPTPGIRSHGVLVEPGPHLGPQRDLLGAVVEVHIPASVVQNWEPGSHLPATPGPAHGGQWREAERGIGQEAALAELERRRDAHQEQLGIDHRGRRGRSDPYPSANLSATTAGRALQLVDAEKERTDQREVPSSSAPTSRVDT